MSVQAHPAVPAFRVTPSGLGRLWLWATRGCGPAARIPINSMAYSTSVASEQKRPLATGTVGLWGLYATNRG